MKGILVKSNSPMKWVPFMVKVQTSSRFFGLIKNHRYFYIHPRIDLLPENLYDLKIGDKVECYFVSDLHVCFPLDKNNLYYPKKD